MVILAEKFEAAKASWVWRVHEASVDEDKQSGPADVAEEPRPQPEAADVHWITKPTAVRVRVVVAFAGPKTEQPSIAPVARLPQTSFGLKDIVRDLHKWAMDPTGDSRTSAACSWASKCGSGTHPQRA